VTTEWAAARRRGDVEALRRQLDAGADIDARDGQNQTALMRAVYDRQADVVRLLVSRGAGLNHTAKYNLTALMLAVIRGQSEIARVLVEAGADVARRGTGAPGFAGKTALDLAIERGDVEIRRLLDAKSG
jgi:ankyrin repeat protein